MSFLLFDAQAMCLSRARSAPEQLPQCHAAGVAAWIKCFGCTPGIAAADSRLCGAEGCLMRGGAYVKIAFDCESRQK